MKKLMLLLFIFGCIACAKKEAPAMDEAPAESMEAVSDSSAADTSAMEEAAE